MHVFEKYARTLSELVSRILLKIIPKLEMMCIKEQKKFNKQTQSPNLHPASLSLYISPLIPLSPVFSVPAQASQGCVCVYIHVLVDQMHSVRQSVTAGCSTALSSHHGSHTRSHTDWVSEGGSIQRLRSPHTLIKTMYLSEKRTLSWDTHTHIHGRWRPLSMPLCWTAQLSPCHLTVFPSILFLSLFPFPSHTVALSYLIYSPILFSQPIID